MPRENNGMIFRSKLNEMFKELSREHIIYVCAPAGYGKTVAVWQWLACDCRSKIDISLDEYDNNVLHFSERFCKALRASQPDNAILDEIALHPAFASAPDEFALRVVAALTEEMPTAFVIDDLHFITNTQVLCLLLALLKRLPANFQIILISRHDLPPKFSELWLKGYLACITTEQLRFTEEESIMLAQKRGTCVTKEQAKHIHRYTNGWAIGINALLLSGKMPVNKVIDYLGEFIRSNIWDKWNEETREFILQTALARELNPSLCFALTGNVDSENVLSQLVQKGAFISQSEDGTYHYHSIFQNFLKEMLTERGEAYMYALIEKEAYWYMAEKEYIQAAECFVSCNSPEGLGLAIDTLSLTNRENFIIERILPLLQTPLFYTAAQNKPYFFTYMAWAAFAEGKSQDMEKYADQFYSMFPKIMEQGSDGLNYIFLLYLVDYRISLQNLLEAAITLPIAPNEDSSPSSVSMNMPLIHRCARDFSEIASQNTELFIKTLKELIGWLFGNEATLLEECLRAGIYYEQGCLDNAYTHALAANAEIRKTFVPELKFCAMSLLIYILDARGKSQEANKIINNIVIMIEEDRAYYLNRNFKAMITRRKLENGDIQAANEWIKKSRNTLYDNVSFFQLYETITTCRAYITIGDYNSAIILLQKTLELAIVYKRPLDIIEIKTLLAITYWKKQRGFQKEALSYLESAVSDAYPFGYTQLFINEGAEISGMMKRLQGRVEQHNDRSIVPANFIKMLYFKTLNHPNSGLTSGQEERTAKFTDKQKTIMKLLIKGNSQKEIAEIVGVKLSTVRSHIMLIYKKLDVTCETEAIKKITTLDIF